MTERPHPLFPNTMTIDDWNKIFNNFTECEWSKKKVSDMDGCDDPIVDKPTKGFNITQKEARRLNYNL